MENSDKQKKLRESIIKWINSQKRDFGQGLKLMKAANYKPHVVNTIEKWGTSDARSHRALNMELRNFIRESRKVEKPEKAAPVPPQDTDEGKIGNIEKELQKEYPDVIKKTLYEFQSLYQRRGILHKELKAIGEANDEKSTNERKEKLNIIYTTSRMMDVLWEVFEKYKADGELPTDDFFDALSNLEKVATTDPPIPGYNEVTLPDSIEELKKLKENLRIKITKGKNRLEFQSEKKGDKPNPMPESPKRAELLKNIEDWEKQKEAVEYKIVELK
jgi:hypothetical protein